MRILFFSWGELNNIDVAEGFLECGHEVMKLTALGRNYIEDPDLVELIKKQKREIGFDLIYSTNYFPVLTKAAKEIGVRYVSWVYDSPHYTLYCEEVQHPCNYIFHFDRVEVERLRSLGVKQIWHLPLACNAKRIQTLQEQNGSGEKYPVSFVGNFVSEAYRDLDRIQGLSERARGYLDGLVDAQVRIQGGDLIVGNLPEWLLQEWTQKGFVPVQPGFFYTSEQILESMVKKKATMQERIRLVDGLSRHVPVQVFSDELPEELLYVKNGGHVDYYQRMPRIFADSQINLNITLRTIASGIPLRCMDIMGSGGLLLSNWQEELADYFPEGENWVSFSCVEDLIEKSVYYLEHEKEAEEIAQAARERMLREHHYLARVEKMLRQIERPDEV